jgi:hypothetical protein
MAIEREISRPSGGFDYQGTYGYVWDKVAVHHVDVNKTCAAAFGGLDFFAELGEVRGED